MIKSLFFSTINLYLIKRYLTNFLLMLCALLALIYMFDVVELLRRAANKDDVSLVSILVIGLYKLPEVGQQLFTFAVLFSAILTLWTLTKRHELLILRAAGLSIWQFIVPILLTAFLIGVVKITMINPLSVLLISRYEVLENEILENNKDPISLSSQGLWLRQTNDDGSKIIHAKGIKIPEWDLKNVTLFMLDQNDNFIQRVDSAQVSLQQGNWYFEKAVINKPSFPPEEVQNYFLPTEMTIAKLENQFSTVDTISFWKFSRYIETLEKTGFNARPLKIHYQSMLSQPLLFMSMILLAATVSLRPPRNNGAFVIILAGVGIGFLVFFSSNFLQALGASAQIPLFIAAWFPAIITFILGIGTLMTLEDG